ncbi:hypothetical protein CH304_00230 [Rhodococcus sp. 15-649-1-2]|nr:hypothetical protein [Rhodococcus sp. 15-649-1-2]OZE88032.1 hypothetical protein CH304_00230 [Rhodococcus sp. 15-649-1-2]
MGLASTLARDWILEVQTAPGTWTRVRALSSVQPMFVTSEQDDSTIDDEGFASMIATGLAYSIEGSCKRQGDNTNGFVDDPGQDFLRKKGRKTGYDNIVTARIYRRDALPDAYRCDHTVKWTDTAAGDVNALQQSTFTLSGRGKPEEIAKPTTGASVTKVISRSAATAGTFTLTVDSQTTSALPWNATALQVQSALEALSNVGEGNVTVTGAVGGAWTAKFSVAVTVVSGIGTSLTPSGTITVT